METILEKAQKNEITEYAIYSMLSNSVHGKNRNILKKIAKDELKHYNILKKITNKSFNSNNLKVWLYYILAHILGFIFVLKYMENGENSAQKLYGKVKDKYKPISNIIKDEELHEIKLIEMISEEKVEYASSIILGLNDALVELTGSIAGLSLALGNTRLIGVSGLIIGVAAALSMTASSYLSSKEDNVENPKKAALYTGIAYILTVILLVSPYFLIDNSLFALGSMLFISISIIATYTLYMSVVKSETFFPRFIEMTLISLGVAIISFIFGWILKNYLGVGI